MAHAPGWIELYDVLAEGRAPSAELIERCRTNRNGIGETMLHWYAIEGAPDVLQKLIDLGYEVDTHRGRGRNQSLGCSRRTAPTRQGPGRFIAGASRAARP